MVMDLVTGGELFDAVAAEGRLPETRTRSYFQQMVDGVQYCHSRRVYHRDLKPENLLLTGDKKTLKITDFGLSSIKQQDTSSELLHTIMGSPHYIAPEIITSAANGYEGSKVDVWAAGVILFGMLAGYLPFDAESTKDLYKAIVHSPVSYPRHFSYDVIKLLRVMLQKDPEKRPTMEQVKSFPWFRVNYEPIEDVPRKPRASSLLDPRKKSRKARSSRHGDRAGKRKLMDGSLVQGESSKEKSITNRMVNQVSRKIKRDVDSKREEKEQDAGQNQQLDAIDISHLFESSDTIKDLPRINSHKEYPQGQHLPMNPQDQENLSPQYGLNRLLQDPKRREPLLPRNSSETTSRRQEENQIAKQVTPEPDLNLCNLFTDLMVEKVKNSGFTEKRTPNKKSVLSQMTALEMLSPETNRTPDYARPSTAGSGTEGILGITNATTSALQLTPVANNIGKGKASFGEHDLQSCNILTSPLSPEDTRFSSSHSDNGVSLPEERRQESLRCRVIENNGCPSARLFSSSSDKCLRQSSHGEREAISMPSKDYRALVPSIFSIHSEETNGFQPAGSVDSAFSGGATPMDAYKDAMGSPMLLTKKISELENGIFRPMRSTFARLVEKIEAERPRPSTWASPLCPEFSDDEEGGGPTWCLEEMDIFADAEDSMGTERQDKTFCDDSSFNWADALESEPEESAQQETQLVRTIFAPLNEHIANQLSPTADMDPLELKSQCEYHCLR